MSTLRATTLANLAGTGSPDITGGELLRARALFNGDGTIAIKDSFNVSSLTDGGVGIYSVTFATASPNTLYTLFAGGTAGSFSSLSAAANGGKTRLAAGISYESTYASNTGGSGTRFDYPDQDVICFGDHP
jgi:hypothetical protein